MGGLRGAPCKVEAGPLLSNLLEAFIMSGCCILSNAFSASIDMIVGFFSIFSLLMWQIILIDFFLIEPALHAWNESCLVTVHNSSYIM